MSASQHVPRQTVRKARPGKRQRAAASIQRYPGEASAPAALTQWTWPCAPKVCSHVCRTTVPALPAEVRCPHWMRGWRAALHSSVTRGRLWARMWGVRSGRVNPRWQEGPGSRAA